MFWLSVSKAFVPFVIDHYKRRKFDVKEVSQLHSRSEGPILSRHLVEHVAVSDLCDEYQLQAMIFYICQKQFFENGAAVFIRDDRPQKCPQEARIQQNEAKLVRKHEVLSEF